MDIYLSCDLFHSPGSIAEPERPAMADAREPLLEVRDLHATYAGSVRALRGVSMWVPDRGVVAVLGTNGAGKTTLLRAISGTLRQEGGSVDGGSIRLAGRPVEQRSPWAVVARGIRHVPEGRRIFGSLTVEENLRVGGRAARDAAARSAARERVHHLFPVLHARRRQRAGLLSGGEQQMLAIGRALMGGPRVLLLDEPSLGLAPLVVARIAEVITTIGADGTAVVLVEQNAAMALRVAGLAFVLEAGEISLHGPAAELAATTEVRDRYLGVGARKPAPGTASRRARSPGPGVRELTVERVSVHFGGIQALSDVSFTVEPGSLHALIGPNGAGKSTCLNVLSGGYAATTGRVRYGADDLTRLAPHRIAALGITRTFQNLALSPGETVLDNLLVARHRHAAGPHAAVRRIAELLGLTELLGARVGQLSYGDRKRVELARALSAEPGLLLLDEPVAGMNYRESLAMEEAIGTIQRELGISIVLVEHDMRFVMGLADRVTVLDFGRRIADGTPEQVRSDPDVLRAYLGAGA
jgi:ABC-type branched-subunit amino acid transport system ATPase component